MEGEETEVESDPAWMVENSSEYNMAAHSMIQKTSARLEFKASLHTKNREMTKENPSGMDFGVPRGNI